MDGVSDAGSSFADVATTASGLMLQVREQPEGLGSSAEDLAFAKFKLPQQRVLAVFRPDLDEMERVSWSLVNFLVRTPCLWPCCCVAYPWLVGCARYNVKALHETLYVATEEGVITLVNNVDKSPMECLAPRIEPAFRRWGDISEVRTKDTADALGKELGDKEILLQFTPAAQQLTSSVGEVWYTSQPQKVALIISKIHKDAGAGAGGAPGAGAGAGAGAGGAQAYSSKVDSHSPQQPEAKHGAERARGSVDRFRGGSGGSRELAAAPIVPRIGGAPGGPHQANASNAHARANKRAQVSEVFDAMEKTIFLMGEDDRSSKESIMVHDDMSVRAFKSLVLYALNLDNYDGRPPGLAFYVQRDGEERRLSSIKELVEKDVVQVRVTTSQSRPEPA
jgi:hypothetical protein